MLACFAVREEAGPTRSLGLCGVEVLLTGIGAVNAERALRARLAAGAVPGLVLSCGFAGALRPGIRAGAVLFQAGGESVPPAVRAALQESGATPARFHCAPRILSTASQKAECLERTGADAVEMESGVIRAICGETGIPMVTVRAISDEAGEDLPLDFNRMLTADSRIHMGRLVARVLREPLAIPGLIRLRKACAVAAEALARCVAAAAAATIPMAGAEGVSPGSSRS